MNKKSWTILAVLTIILSIATLVELLIMDPCSGTIATVRGGSLPMKCHYTFTVEIPVAILLILSAVGQFFLKGPEARYLSELFVIALSIFGISLTTGAVIGICNKSMACYPVALFCRIMFGLLIVTSIIQLIISTRTKEKHKRQY